MLPLQGRGIAYLNFPAAGSAVYNDRELLALNFFEFYARNALAGSTDAAFHAGMAQAMAATMRIKARQACRRSLARVRKCSELP
jgi:DNA-binding FadR family transcriptional regulator